MNNLNGTWYVHYLQGKGHPLSHYSDCVKLEVGVENGGEARPHSHFLSIKDKRKMSRFGTDYTQTEQRFQCHHHHNLEPSPESDNLNLLKCTNTKNEASVLHLLSSTTTPNPNESQPPFLIIFNTLNDHLDPRKHHIHVALRNQHIQETPNHYNTGSVHPVEL